MPNININFNIDNITPFLTKDEIFGLQPHTTKIHEQMERQEKGLRNDKEGIFR